MTSIKSRVDAYRQKQENKGSVRADLYIPVELKERVKKYLPKITGSILKHWQLWLH